MTTKTSRPPVTAIIAAAGQGTRLGAALPKAYVQVGGMSLLSRSVQLMQKSGVVDDIIVLVSPQMEEFAGAMLAQELGHCDVKFVHGGGERADSVWAGLQAISADAAPDSASEDASAPLVLIHDAARALTPPEMVVRVVERLREGASAVIPVLPVADTIKVVEGDQVTETAPRASLRAVQTPQGFDLAALRAANQRYFAEKPKFVATDDASLMEWAGHTVHTVEGDPLAFKITTPIDLTLASALLAQGHNNFPQ